MIKKEDLIKEVANKLIRDNITISFAESITGGLAMSSLVANPGVSKVFKGGIVCYQQEVKETLLNADPILLKKYSCESIEASCEIAKRLRELMHSDITVGITGLASEGGSESFNKPVGSVFICIMTESNTYKYHNVFLGYREEIREKAVYFCYEKIWTLLFKHMFKLMKSETQSETAR